ncbi:MAG TPA: anthranilate phosphoribosyltransferase [Dehalococcoidia bacterium]|nr:anthranilate phosphoribosyltransferase [Dehalococcoidia bacterium]
MDIKEAIDTLVNHRRDISEDDAAEVMRGIMTGEASPAQIGAFLAALRMKGETVDEVTGMARAMREQSLRVETEGVVVDTCGTGGDASGTFNVSTAAAFVTAGAGARVAKHGNRAMSSGCGSADVLEALGAKIDLNPDQVGQCLRETGIGFMFAQVFHPAMKYVAPARREIGIRTVFNILGPLTNPAGARYQLLGVARAELAPMIAAVLSRLGTHHALVVHGDGGLDEISLTGESHVHEVRDGNSREYFVSPEDMGLAKAPLAAVKGGTPEENAEKLRAVLNGQRGPLRDIVALNAAAALVAVDLAPDIKAGVRLAEETIDSGAARAKLEAFVLATNAFD